MNEDDKIHMHIDANEQRSNLPEQEPDLCPLCKIECVVGFGLAGGGYGAYTYCPQCGTMLSKTQDHGI